MCGCWEFLNIPNIFFSFFLFFFLDILPYPAETKFFGPSFFY